MSSAASLHTLGPLLDARCLPWGGACDVPIASYVHMRSLRRPFDAVSVKASGRSVTLKPAAINGLA